MDRYNRTEFIEGDPISVPHKFTKKKDIEIAGFLSAMLAWGRRSTIISKANELLSLMDNDPYHFIIDHIEKDRRRFLQFKHRTFQPTDALYFIEALQIMYREYGSLEQAFLPDGQSSESVELALTCFHERFFNHPYAPDRTRKHVSTPDRKSSCKRLNMFLRWMVRSDDRGVDFGIWNKLKQSQLMIPFDVHVARVARSLGLLERKQNDWKAVELLTQRLREFDSGDPVKYDYALFGLGVLNKPLPPIS